MIKKNYNILPKLNGEIVNFVTNSSSRIYKNNILVSDFPIGDFSKYIDTIYEGFYINKNVCKFVGVSYFLEDDYTIITSNLGNCIKFDSSSKTKLTVIPINDYNTITIVLELTNWYNYLFFVWDDKWDILYKKEISTPYQIWFKNVLSGYYVLYINTVDPPVTIVEYNNNSYSYYESLVTFYAEGNTSVTVSGSGLQTIYLRSIGDNEFFVKTTTSGLYIYSKKTKLGPFKFPISTPCVVDFECFVVDKDTDIYVYCNYFLIGFGKLYNFSLVKSKSINFNIASINILNTLLSAKIYSFGLYTNKKACPTSVCDICCRSISSPIVKTNMYDDTSLYIYKTDYSVWVLDYYNGTVMVLYGDKLKKSKLSSLYNNLIYAHDNYVTVSYGFSLDKYCIVDVLYNKNIFILLLEDRLVIIDRFGVVLRYIHSKNISKLFYIDNYVLFYDKTRARLYRVYSNDFKNFELPSVLMNINFSTKFKAGIFGSFNAVGDAYISVVKEQSIFGYRPLYNYLDIRTYTIGTFTKSNLIFEYDCVQKATKFTGIMTSLAYRVFANNPIESTITSFTLFVSIKSMSLKFKRYIIRIPEVLDVYMVNGELKVELKCRNTHILTKCSQIFNVNKWYDIYITYHANVGLYIYVNGCNVGKTEFNYDTGGTLGQKYIIIGSYNADYYGTYKFKGFIRDNIFIIRSFVTKEMIVYLNNNNVRDPETFLRYNNYTNIYGVTSLISSGNLMFIGAYDGLYVYETSTFKLVKIFESGNAILGIRLSGQKIVVSSIKLPVIGKITGSSGEIVKIKGELYGRLFIGDSSACYSCIYNGYTYVKLLNDIVFVVDASNYFKNDTICGCNYFGKFSLDSLSTEIQLVGEFGYDELNDGVIAYNNSFVNSMFSCCTIYPSTILYPIVNTKTNYDIFLDIECKNEITTIINLFGITMELNLDHDKSSSSNPLYTFIISRYGSLKLPYECFSTKFAETFFNALPCRLYHSEGWLLNSSKERRLKLYFDVSASNLKLLKKRKVKVLENYIESSSRFAYDFHGGLGNGVEYKTENNTVFGYFNDFAYFINKNFDDVPVWNLSAEFILRINSYRNFNPIFSKSTKSKLSYELALCGKNLKFLWGQKGINSILDLKVSIDLNKWIFIAIYVSDVYIDIFVDGNYNRVSFYGNPDIIESELYVGFGIFLNNRAKNFIGDMLYFDINKHGTLLLINRDYNIYINSKSETIAYDEIINLNKYYNIKDNLFKMTSTFFLDLQHPVSRYFQLYNFYMIGYDCIKTVVNIQPDIAFSGPILRKLSKIDVNTLNYDSYPFIDCIDFAFDSADGLYILTKDNEVKYSLENITNINKFKYITTIKHSNKFTLFGTLGGIVKVDNVFTDDVTKQYWLLDNGVNSLLITDAYVYVAYGKKLGFVQIKYLEDNLKLVITRELIPLYTGEAIIKSVIRCNSKIYILSNKKIINITDMVDVYCCEDANSLFNYDNDVLIIYDNYIKKLSNEEIILTVPGKITDVSYGDVLVISTSSGFYVFDEVTNKFVFNSIGITGLLKDFEAVSDYCYYVYINNNNVVYIYRDIVGIKLIEFNIDNKKIINNVILSSLISGSFSDYVPSIFDSTGL